MRNSEDKINCIDSRKFVLNFITKSLRNIKFNLNLNYYKNIE